MCILVTRFPPSTCMCSNEMWFWREHLLFCILQLYKILLQVEHHPFAQQTIQVLLCLTYMCSMDSICTYHCSYYIKNKINVSSLCTTIYSMSTTTKSNKRLYTYTVSKALPGLFCTVNWKVEDSRMKMNLGFLCYCVHFTSVATMVPSDETVSSVHFTYCSSL